MPTSLDKLLSMSSPSLNDAPPTPSERVRGLAGSLAGDLIRMLRARNGFYAFEGALHVFPSHSSQRGIGLEEWNDHALWRTAYHDMPDDRLFFAEDLFGGQFCVTDGEVHTFDPETGYLEYLADDIE